MMHVEVLIVLTAIFCFKDVHSSCDQYEIEQCMQPITDLRHKLGISDELKYFPIYKLNSAQLDEYCVDGEKVGICLNQLTGCEKVARKLFEGFLDSFDFLCKETLPEYKQYQPCFGKQTVIDELEQCDKETSDALKFFNTDSFDAKDQFCSIVKDDYSCIKKAVENRCGKKAAEWEIKYVKKVISPMLEIVGCHAIPRWAVWIIIGISSVVIGVLIRCCIVACVNKRKKNQMQAAGANTFHNVLAPPPVQPPAYAEVGKVV